MVSASVEMMGLVNVLHAVASVREVSGEAAPQRQGQRGGLRGSEG